jgi:hypothetical protein
VTNVARHDTDSLHRRLVRYYYDCLAAQTDWSRAINVVEQKDVTLVPLSAIELRRFGQDGVLRMTDPDAIELAKRVAAGGSDTSLSLGALFIVGRIAAQGEQAEKRFCAPLLEVSLTLREESKGQITIYPDETEFSVNYSLVGELLDGDIDDLQDRLADLAEWVPDFPIDAGEFDNFWNGFRVVAPEVPVSRELPKPTKQQASTRIVDLGLTTESNVEELDPDSGRLEIVDFYLPQIAKGDEFRLLPATAIVFGRQAGRTMSALSELRAMEEMQLSQTAFGCVFDPATARAWSSKPADRDYPDEVQPLPLSPAQEAIVESARTSPLTVVTGPPGTGKSYTITAIVLDALLSGETVLVASQMDKAVEVVADQVESLAGSLAIARSGGRAAQRKLAKKVARLTGPSSSLETVMTSDVKDCAHRHYELTRRMQQLEGRFAEVIEAERNWSQSHVSYDRSQPLCLLPVMEVSAARVEKARRLIERAKRNLGDDPGFMRRWLARWEIGRARRLLEIPAASDTDVDALEELDELIRAQTLRVHMRQLERDLKAPFPADRIWQELADIDRQRHQTAIELLRLMRHKRLQRLVADQQHRVALRDLAKLLRRRKHELKRQLQQKLSAELLLETFPAWACTSRSLCQVLPATPALFDIVVIDEASQCDLALASVALMRAKRAVVVGDPNQLRHVSFLSRAREHASFVRSEFTPEMQQRFHYRRSLFDVAADAVDQRHFFLLDEHFRSHPQIIEFSNRRFYDEQLHIMTGRPSRQPQSAISVSMVDGHRELDSSVNRAEVDAVLEEVRSITSDQGGSKAVSIGVVSPFRDHADAIRERLLREYSSEVLSRHSIVVGTAHSLQGDEKDIVILSTSIDSQSHPASLRFLQSPNLFNVAITRARHRLIVVTSMRLDELPAGLLRDFLLHAGDGWIPQQSPDESGCLVESTIVRELKSEQIDIWTGFRSAGSRINVVAMGEESAIAVMCDGSNHQGTPISVLASQRRLARAGWIVNRIPHRTLHKDWNACLSKIIDRIGN